MGEYSVGIKEHACFVFLQELGDDCWLLPRRTSIFELLDVDVVVLVSVDLCYELSEENQ